MTARTQALTVLRAHRLALTRQFGVRSLALFGSVARDQTGAGSDVDILVAFDGQATSARYFGCSSILRICWGVPWTS